MCQHIGEVVLVSLIWHRAKSNGSSRKDWKHYTVVLGKQTRLLTIVPWKGRCWICLMSLQNIQPQTIPTTFSSWSSFISSSSSLPYSFFHLFLSFSNLIFSSFSFNPFSDSLSSSFHLALFFLPNSLFLSYLFFWVSSSPPHLLTKLSLLFP